MIKRKMMKRQILTLLLCGIALLCCAGCAGAGGDDAVAEEQYFPVAATPTVAAAQPAAAVLVAPVPEQGEKIAEIAGRDYLYDRFYAFKLSRLMYPLIPSEDQVRALVNVEIFALEAKAQGLSVLGQDYANELDFWQNVEEYLDADVSYAEDAVAAIDPDAPEEMGAELIENLARAKVMKTRYENMMTAVLLADDVSEEEFLVAEGPYIKKLCLAQAYALKIYKDFYADHHENDPASYDAYVAYATAQVDALWDKYDVKAVY